MRGKRAFLLGEETLKIVIAVIVIIFLIGFLIKLYFSTQNQDEEKQAQATLDKLKVAIDSGATEFTVYNPGGWHILSWPLESREEFPQICLKNNWNNCLCITKITLNPSPKNFAEESRICVEISKRIIVRGTSVQSPIMIYHPPIKLKISYGEEIIIEKNG